MMANIIEKNLPPKVRKNFKTAIVAGISFFIALQANDYFKRLFATILPDTDGLVARGIMLLLIITAFAFLLAGLDDFLDGK